MAFRRPSQTLRLHRSRGLQNISDASARLPVRAFGKASGRLSRKLRVLQQVLHRDDHDRRVRPGQRAHRDRCARIRVELLRKHPRRQRAVGGPVQIGKRLLEFLEGIGPVDEPLRDPQRADHPRVSGHIGHIRVLDAVVVVALVTGQPADMRLDPQPLPHRLHVRDHLRIVGAHRAEREERERRAVERHVEPVRAVRERRRHAREAVAVGFPHVAHHRAAHALGRLVVLRRAVVRAHVLREARGGLQRADRRRDREEVHAAALLPQVPRRQRKPVVIAVLEDPVRRLDDERVV